MMPLPVVATLVLPAFAGGCPPAVAWNDPQHRAAPPPQAVTPDGWVHQLTTGADRVCWWSIDEAGDTRVHRYWYRNGPHPVAIAARADGAVVLLARGREWELWLVEPDGAERRWPTWGAAAAAGLAVVGEEAVIEWRDEAGGRLRSRVALADGALLEVLRRREVSDGPR